MSRESGIEWTESTWNPVRGCTRISPGCAHCYAETFAERWRGIPGHPYEQGFDLKLVPELLEMPLRWKSPRTIFVNSMSDLFHEGIPAEYIRAVFVTMNRANWHTFQILTKRSRRLLELGPELSWSSNIWMGVTVENQDCAYRMNHLRTIPAAVRFISAEPLLGPLELDLSGIDWVVAGGESGHGARPMKAWWVESIRDQCLERGVAFFFKQWGGVRKKAAGRILDGVTWDQMPEVTRHGAGRLLVVR